MAITLGSLEPLATNVGTLLEPVRRTVPRMIAVPRQETARDADDKVSEERTVHRACLVIIDSC